MAEWTTVYVNDLPDSAFLHVESGGTKDDQDRTVPRSLRHFPVRDASGAVDMPHLRNAMSRIPQSDLPQEVKDRATTKAQRMMEEAGSMRDVGDEFDVRSSDNWDESEFEVRAESEGHNTLDGYAARFDLQSKTLSILDLTEQESRGQLGRFGRRSFREIIHPGAFTKALSEIPDVTLHVQHNLLTLPLARTKAGTMTLAEDTRGLHVLAELPDNEWGRPVRDAVKRGDIAGMSFRMRGVIDRWATETGVDYSGPVRHLHEIRLHREISLVSAPAYVETQAAIRHLAEEAEIEPDALVGAFDVLRTPDGHLTTEQRDMLMTAINARVDEPYISPKLAQMQQRLAAAFPG